MYSADEEAFYSALDADSESEEGKFYVWTEEELKAALGDDYSFAQAYYNINNAALWEHGNNILLRVKSDDKVANELNLSIPELEEKVATIKKVLLTLRAKRVRPGLDDKTLCSWNAMTIKAFCHAYQVLGKEQYLDFAEKNADFIFTKMKMKDGGLYHTYKNGEAKIAGYLEDYAFTIEACIALYETTFNEAWLERAAELMAYSITNFENTENGMFYYSSLKEPEVVSRKVEIYDNVIPSTNGVMAHNLYQLSIYLHQPKWKEKAEQMLMNVNKNIAKNTSYFSQWAQVLNKQVYNSYEVVFVGENAKTLCAEWNTNYHPNVLLAGSTSDNGNSPLLESRYVNGKTLIYVCQNNACKLPVTAVKEAQQLIK